MDVTQIRLAIFDIGQTLLFLTPSSEENLLTRCHQLTIDVALEDLKRGCKVAELWVAQTIVEEQKGSPRIPDEEFDRRWDSVALKEALKGRNEKVDDLVKKLWSVPRLEQRWSVPPETYMVLDKLQAEGLILGIVSNFSKTLPDLCRKMGIDDYFHFIITSEEVGVEKPDPRILRIALQRAQVKPAAAVYVGDHPYDILCAKHVPMPMIWFNKDNDPLPNGFISYPDHQISALPDILDIIL